jgi:hypothetical protein
MLVVVGAVLVTIVGTLIASTNGPPTQIAAIETRSSTSMSIPLAAVPPSEYDVYRNAAYGLITARNEIEAWDTKGLNKKTSEKKRADYIEVG